MMVYSYQYCPNYNSYIILAAVSEKSAAGIIVETGLKDVAESKLMIDLLKEQDLAKGDLCMIRR